MLSQAASSLLGSNSPRPLSDSLDVQQSPIRRPSKAQAFNPNDLDCTTHAIRGNGILASKKELSMSEESFAIGCTLLLAAARDDLPMLTRILAKDVQGVSLDFRDYDRRTALHIAAAEGALNMVKYLIDSGSKVNRSDRWGGSPLDDAIRHRHKEVASFLREQGATTGNADLSANLISAAFDGDLDEVVNLVEEKVDVNRSDYDQRTALHLAAGEGRTRVVQYLLENFANPNVEDRFGNRPLDDAMRNDHTECIDMILSAGGMTGSTPSNSKSSATGIELSLDDSQHSVGQKNYLDSMKVDWKSVEMIDKIGSGEFGEIFKCRWRGSMVAAKCVKSAKIKKEWMKLDAKNSVIDALGDSVSKTTKDLALNDFRIETSILRQLRHPNICMLLGYSNTKDFEVMISELMKCSLLDVFKANVVHGTHLSKKRQARYAIELAKGMNYLHTCKPPVLHRDLKPANLLLDFKDTLKISDFGLAKLRPEKDHQQSETFVMTGETGSYRFMAPEVFRHENYDETVDVYSFAMILYNIMSGQPPWPNLGGIAAVRAASIDGARPNIPRDWDVRLSNLITSCWSEEPRKRPKFTNVLETLQEYHEAEFGGSVDQVSASGKIDWEDQTGCPCVIS